VPLDELDGFVESTRAMGRTKAKQMIKVMLQAKQRGCRRPMIDERRWRYIQVAGWSGERWQAKSG
jgi:hypothetical protein